MMHGPANIKVRYIVLNGFRPWVRGGRTARSRGPGGFQCGEGVYPDNHAQRTIEILQPPFFLATLVLWLFLASKVFGITLSLVRVCIHFTTAILNVFFREGIMKCFDEVYNKINNIHQHNYLLEHIDLSSYTDRCS